MALLLFFLFIALLGFGILKINNRSILGGITLASGTLLSLVTLLFIGLDKIYLHFKNGDLITLAIAYLLIPAVFIGICLYFIFNSRTMQTKEGKSVTAKLSAGLGLNLLIALPAFLYLLSSWHSANTLCAFSVLTFSIVNGSFADLSICCLRLVFMDVPNDSFKKSG